MIVSSRLYPCILLSQWAKTGRSAWDTEEFDFFPSPASLCNMVWDCGGFEQWIVWVTLSIQNWTRYEQSLSIISFSFLKSSICFFRCAYLLDYIWINGKWTRSYVVLFYSFWVLIQHLCIYPFTPHYLTFAHIHTLLLASESSFWLVGDLSYLLSYSHPVPCDQ